MYLCEGSLTQRHKEAERQRRESSLATFLFEGDELSNTARIDLAKVQMFYFTVIAAICFFVMVFKLLVAAKDS
jgi:hypothetical protein